MSPCCDGRAGGVTLPPHPGVDRQAAVLDRRRDTSTRAPAGSATGSSARFTTQVKPGSRSNASTPGSDGRQVSVAAAQRRMLAAQPPARPGTAPASSRRRPSCGGDGHARRSPRAAAATAPAAPAGPKPNGAAVARPRQRHAAAVAAAVGVAGPLARSGPAARRPAGPRPRAGPAPRPGRRRRRRAARASAGRRPGPGGCPARGRASRRAAGAASECRPRPAGGPAATRAGRRRGWTAPRWRARRPSPSVAASSSMPARSAPASHGATRKAKLNAVCSSSGRR